MDNIQLSDVYINSKGELSHTVIFNSIPIEHTFNGISDIIRVGLCFSFTK